MNEGKKLAEQLLNVLIGQCPRVKLGHGSFITMDFGKDIQQEINTRRGPKILHFGEWYLWVYMCAWRIDCAKEPLVGANDDRELIQSKLLDLNNQKFLGCSVLNSAFDATLKFESGYELKLFSYNVTESEQWKFFTPDKKVFSAGPGNTWRYESSVK